MMWNSQTGNPIITDSENLSKEDNTEAISSDNVEESFDPENILDKSLNNLSS